MRIKRGATKRKKHTKTLNLAKGYRLSYHRLYRRAKEALLHAFNYSRDHRKKRGNDFKTLWIKRINAALTPHNIRYSQFMNMLSKSKIGLNKKVLSDLALDNVQVFDDVVKATTAK